MKRSDYVTRMLNRYGSAVVITPKGGNAVRCKAMIQPTTVRRIPDSDAVGVVGGNRDNDGVLYIGPVACRLDQMPGEILVKDVFGKIYRVVNARCMLDGDAPVYVWAVLQQTEEMRCDL